VLAIVAAGNMKDYKTTEVKKENKITSLNNGE